MEDKSAERIIHTVMLKRDNFLSRAMHLYTDGFRQMTVGRTLWLVIIVKLVIMFGIIRFWLMPSVLGAYDSDAERARAVRHALR